MELKVANVSKKSIVYGSVIKFEKYGTAYVVHVPDLAAAIMYGKEDQGEFQLYRLDGQKAYRRKPFTYEELHALVINLKGQVYNPDQYELVLRKKK